LTTLVQDLKKAMFVAGVVEIHTSTKPVDEPLLIWDEVVNEPVHEPVPVGTEPMDIEIDEPVVTGPEPIEKQILSLPSNGNVGPEYAQLEINQRISHADLHLGRIRDLIAEKSFQFSHVIRVAPRKDVNTRSRAEVKKLNLEISIHCRLYTQCRARLIILGAPPEITNRFQVLTARDVIASTAIVKPNEPGSTKLMLSWIWQSSGGHRWGLTAGNDAEGTPNNIECKSSFHWPKIPRSLFTVRRVHWLRSRAQLMRWQEEVTLNGYEMQWTVRYFRHMSSKWVIPSESHTPAQGSSTGAGISSHCLTEGAIAYWNRKHAVYDDLMKKADIRFQSCNTAYVSPL
jgi:hypothetical protein